VWNWAYINFKRAGFASVHV